jgi:hypothetical protein
VRPLLFSHEAVSSETAWSPPPPNLVGVGQTKARVPESGTHASTGLEQIHPTQHVGLSLRHYTDARAVLLFTGVADCVDVDGVHSMVMSFETL